MDTPSGLILVARLVMIRLDKFSTSRAGREIHLVRSRWFLKYRSMISPTAGETKQSHTLPRRGTRPRARMHTAVEWYMSQRERMGFSILGPPLVRTATKLSTCPNVICSRSRCFSLMLTPGKLSVVLRKIWWTHTSRAFSS